MISSATISKLKHNRIVRIIFWPIITCIRLWRRVFFRFTNDSRYILSLKGKFQGNRCFIIGNGPSLVAADLEKLHGEYTFASNRIYKIFDKTDWRPTFYVVLDADLIREDIRTLRRLELDNMFIRDTANKYMIFKKKKWCTISVSSKFSLSTMDPKFVTFSSSPEKYIGCVYTVTAAAMQLAIHMGFTEIYLLGVDHSYPITVESDGTKVITGQANAHFYQDMKKLTPPVQNVDASNRSYQVAKEYADKNGIKIYNATRGGKLEIFERVDFDSLF